MKRYYALLLVLLAFSLLLVGCSANTEQEPLISDEAQVIRVQAAISPPSIPLVNLTDDETIELSWYQGMDEAMSKIINGDVDISIIPVNSMSILHNKGVDIQLGAVTTWGILYLVTKDETITDWQNLKGQRVGVGARGFSPDLVFRSLLQSNNLNLDELEIVYGNSPEIAQMLLAGKVKVAVLPEPLLTSVLMKDASIRIVMNMEEEWNRAFPQGMGLPQAGLAVSKDFASKNPNLWEEFCNKYDSNLEKYLKGEKVTELEAEILKLPAEVIEESLNRSNLKFVPGEEAALSVDNYLKVLMLVDPDAVGERVPEFEGDFYKRD